MACPVLWVTSTGSDLAALCLRASTTKRQLCVRTASQKGGSGWTADTRFALAMLENYSCSVNSAATNIPKLIPLLLLNVWLRANWRNVNSLKQQG